MKELVNCLKKLYYKRIFRYFVIIVFIHYLLYIIFYIVDNVKYFFIDWY